MTQLIIKVDLSRGYKFLTDQTPRNYLGVRVGEESLEGWKSAAEALGISVTQTVHLVGVFLQDAVIATGDDPGYNDGVALTEVREGRKT